MTDDEKAAMDWLDHLIKDLTPGNSIVRHARTIKAMLAEPRLPKEPTRDMIDVITVADGIDAPGWQKEIYRALYDHLSKPATRSVQVWHVLYSFKSAAGTWVPLCAVYTSEGSARRWADWSRAQPDHDCVTVTGPHNQETPA